MVDKEKKRNFWWWLLIILFFFILFESLDNSENFDDYRSCVDNCKSNLYCLSWDIQDQYGTDYMSHENFESCRSVVFSCLDNCE